MRAVNLIPSEQRPGGGSLVGRSGGGALIVLGVIVAVAVLALLYGSAARQISEEGGEVAKLQQQTSEVRARTGRLTPYTSFVAMAEQRTKTVAQLVQARFDWSHTLHELGRVLPRDTALLTLTGSATGTTAGGATSTAPAAAAGATPASSTPPGSTPSLTLTGCSTSQTEVAQMLQRLRLMDGVAEVHLQSAVAPGVSTASAASSCGGTQVVFTVSVSFAALPATPIPSVAAPTVPASSSTAKSGAHTEQVSANAKGAKR